MTREPRFPGIDWYCDHCGALLNSQKGFDDHKYVWKCKKCGYKNSISWDNIRVGDSRTTKFLLHFLGFISYVGLWTAVMLGIGLLVFDADRSRYLVPFLVFLGMYIAVSILTLFVEFGLRHTTFSSKNLRIVIFRNLKEDLTAPLFAVKELISNLLSFITRKIPFKRKYVWHSNKQIVLLSLVYVLIAVLEIVALCVISGIDLQSLIR